MNQYYDLIVFVFILFVILICLYTKHQKRKLEHFLGFSSMQNKNIENLCQKFSPKSTCPKCPQQSTCPSPCQKCPQCPVANSMHDINNVKSILDIVIKDGLHHIIAKKEFDSLQFPTSTLATQHKTIKEIINRITNCIENLTGLSTNIKNASNAILTSGKKFDKDSPEMKILTEIQTKVVLLMYISDQMELDSAGSLPPTSITLE